MIHSTCDLLLTRCAAYAGGMATTPGIDVSHWQGTIDWAAVKRAGFEFAILKATERDNYVDPTFAANRAKARAAGLVIGFYHFARATDPAREADWFCKAVGSLSDGEFVVLDWEVPHSDAPGWCKAWLDRVASRLGVRPLIYMNQSAMRGSNWTDTVVRGGYALWLAKYDNSTAAPAVTQWAAAAMKQYTDKGAVPGIGGGVDVNVFYGTRDQLIRYTKQSGQTAATEGEDDMAGFSREDLVKIAREGVWGPAPDVVEGKTAPIWRLIGIDEKTNGIAVAVSMVTELTKALGSLAASRDETFDQEAFFARVDATVEGALLDAGTALRAAQEASRPAEG